MQTKHVVTAVIVFVGILSIPLILSARKGDGAQITRRVFNDIQYGATYQQVVDTVGREGIKMDMPIEEAMQLKNVEGKLYGIMRNKGFEVWAWKNRKGSASGNDPRIFVFFAGGRMVAKKQVGLD